MTFRLDLNLGDVAAQLNEGAEAGVRLAVEHLLTEANKTVPHDEGTLERSGTTSVSGTEGAVSYDTPYAVYQHERTDLHHYGKGRAKWLENTLTGEAPTVGRIVAQAMKRRMG